MASSRKSSASISGSGFRPSTRPNRALRDAPSRDLLAFEGGAGDGPPPAAAKPSASPPGPAPPAAPPAGAPGAPGAGRAAGSPKGS